ncbi:diaminopimelate epimerase [Thiorhodococcus mannitoliphagus]|uniref:Diaminopimelate epimerase n=1 Tax=Thiorhodococcus mannitoliphagus TaxID=329406 RepID=A0A6P1DPF5_9GAMM|nr:diaminopimelate epimerase [Thiorhodococcus mannitoliphagus]NEX19450.1 diaminopimelate epimerase [Thiorhodococcus mannitoliphagus]
MKLRFTKMQGLGNDFVVFDAIRQKVELTPETARHYADRRFGIGCDQILLVEPPRLPETDFHYRIFNADGSEVEQCGNGARCFARFVRDQGLTDKDEIPVGTAAGKIRLYMEADGQVRVDMGRPELRPERIPFLADSEADTYEITVDGQRCLIGAVSMGNPHAVLMIDDLDSAPVAELGPLLESHPRFPQRVNVGFMQILSPQHVRLRVYERGAGETLACGTGACAAVVSGQLRGQLTTRTRVSLRGGDLMIEWRGPAHSVWMTGPAIPVFEGEIER